VVSVTLVLYATACIVSILLNKQSLLLLCVTFSGVCCFGGSFIVTGDVLGHVKFFDQELKLIHW